MVNHSGNQDLYKPCIYMDKCKDSEIWHLLVFVINESGVLAESQKCITTVLYEDGEFV